jgi:hypothetical protein
VSSVFRKIFARESFATLIAGETIRVCIGGGLVAVPSVIGRTAVAHHTICKNLTTVPAIKTHHADWWIIAM